MKSDGQNEDSRIPIYLGITGHRNLRDEDKKPLQGQIVKVIREKQLQCPNTPIVVLTPLAEGADQLGALAALEAGIPYIVPLPMPLEEYRKDFTSEEAQNEFNTLLEKAQYSFELPLTNGTSIHDLSRDPKKRGDQYYQVGVFIARHSQTLIALWDGLDSHKRGGTSQVVEMRRTGVPAASSLISRRLRNRQVGPICHIVTPRIGGPVPSHALSVHPTGSGPKIGVRQVEKSEWEVLRHIDSFNRDVLRVAPRLTNEIERGRRILLTDDPTVNNNVELKTIAQLHSVTSALATHFQMRRFLALKALFVLVVIAFMFFQAYVEFWHRPEVLLFYPLTMALGAGWIFVARHKRYEQKHEDYRALSEAFRTKFFLTYAGNHSDIADHYLNRHRGELEWVIYALSAALVRVVGGESRDREELLKKYRYVNEHWILDQVEYFRSTCGSYIVRVERRKALANGIFLGALGSAFLLLLVEWLMDFLPPFVEHNERLIHSVLVVCTHTALVISAAVHGYLEKMVFGEQSKAYQQMAHLFGLAHEKITKAIDSGEVQEAGEIVWELAQEALMENADWLLLHRARPMELPKG
jgi:hypothetical protein